MKCDYGKKIEESNAQIHSLHGNYSGDIVHHLKNGGTKDG